MEKLVNHCDMELMKMAMLRHEETFRQQVHELHRLYRVQKQLMMSGGVSRPSSELIGCRRRQTRRSCRQPRRALDLRLPADDYILVVAAGNATPPPRQEDGLELTLAVGGGGAGRRKRRDEGTGTGTPVGSDCSGGSLTSSSSITDTTSGSPPFLLQEGAAAVTQQPPWLVQCLSLKMAAAWVNGHVVGF
ncbi:hypothetical protein SEVIR_9G170400v4 [Setaria viridis]|uniref:Uncharacterized protein n=2 Tax=Setaria TaxID=4554 RepID=K4AFJ6_SETIT|nr:uncharacterized protein LOC101764994 [Setaria italica]XP_034575593.1 uncharacterized protein LOC117839383 [Setaria viridis]RCV41903.1 hypothetical protein SETIT_9G172100v2 [Setaria italica]TKV92573.1 hypothetical protein SEVIR_9G170400v2 [Setaria viridis]